MADGSVNIKVDAETKQAQKELAKLERDVQKTAASMEKTTSKRNGLADQLREAEAQADATRQKVEELQQKYDETKFKISPDNREKIDATEFENLRSQLPEMSKELYEQNKLLEKQTKTVGDLKGKLKTVDTQLAEQTAKYETQTEQVGQLRASLMQTGGHTMAQLKAGADAASKQFNKLFKNILKWGFGIRSTFILVRKLRAGITEGFKAYMEKDPETKANVDALKASLNGLKLAWGAAFAPIVNAVAPLLRKLVEWLTAAGNAVARFFAVLSGKNTYKKAVANMNSVAGAATGAGNAVEEAKKQIMGFDEINQLDDNKNSGGSGGAGGGLGELVEETIDMDSFAAKLAFSVKDVLFDWSDLTPEQIAEKALAGLFALGGAIIGGMIGGVPGAIIGALAGLALGIALDATIFNFDGELSRDELIRSLILAAGFVGGALIGFALGGPVGALLGASLGLMLAFALNDTVFDPDGHLNKDALFDTLVKAVGLFSGAGIGFEADSPLGAALALGLGFLISFPFVKINWSNIKDEIDGFAEKIRNYFKSYIDKWTKSGSEEANKVGFNVVMGFMDGVWNLWKDIRLWFWNKLIKPLIDAVLQFFGIDSPSKVFEEIGEYIVEGLWEGIEDKWSEFIDFFEGLWDALVTWWDGLSLGEFHIPHPVFEWTYSEATGLLAKAMEFVGLPPSVPHLNISWMARGGIVDGATLIGAGEKGREAIIPLERNTEWIRKVAEELLGMMENRFSGAMAGIPMPAMAMGGVVPPRAVSGGSMGFSDADIQRLVAGIQSALSGNNSAVSIENKVYLDGKQISDAVTKWQRRSDRAGGI